VAYVMVNTHVHYKYNIG